MPSTCKGTKKDGTACESKAVMVNGYCYAHQDQVSPEPIDVSGPWTRERLEAAIEAHGGPEGLDLAGADLSNLDLHGMDLHGITLSHVDVESKEWIAANLQEARLWRTDLRQAELGKVNLQRADLANANLRSARLPRADLQGAVLASAHLEDADLQLANLQGADLRSAHMQRAQLPGANLAKADLYDADLREAWLDGSSLTEARLVNAHLKGVGLWSAKLRGADLHGAEMQEAHLRGADLRGVDLYKATLQEANLAGVNLQGAILWQTNLRDVDLTHADLRGVDLLDTLEMRGIRLHRAKLDRTLLRREQLGPAIGDELAGDYDEARDAYLALKQNFESLGDYDGAAWAYIEERHMERKCSAPRQARRFYGREQLEDTGYGSLPIHYPRVWRFYLRHTAKYINDTLQWWICGYGERPWHTVVTMAFVFALFVALYWATWCVGRVVVLPDGTETIEATRDLMDIIIFSLGAFTTMDAAGLAPRAPIVQVLMGIEALLGISLTGLLGFVIGNRIRRS